MKLFNPLATASRSADAEVKLQEISDRLDRLEELMHELRLSLGVLPAIVRKLYLSDVDLPAPYDLLAERFHYSSQNQEDGLLLALFKRIGTTNRKCVDIGCGLNGGNTGFLVGECGWTGLMMDADRGKISRIQTRYAGHALTAIKHRVTREDVNETLQAHGFIGEIDLFSLDIDGMDYWVWEALMVCNPRVAILEFNWLFGPDRAVTVPYDPEFEVGKKGTRAYRGASLQALVHLARRKGYRLIATERINAVFLRNDIAPEIPEIDARRAYRPPSNLARSKDVYQKIEQQALPLVTVTAAGVDG